jgi:hypothetical protein
MKKSKTAVEQPIEGESAEEILSTKQGLKQEGILCYIRFDEAIDAMNEYSQKLKDEIYALELMLEYAQSSPDKAIIAKQSDLRSELVQFLAEIKIELPEDKDCLDIVDEYLKQKP